MIGGLGPESTVEYYLAIIALYRERLGDGSYPQFIVNSIDLRKGIDLITANDLAGAAAYLVEEIQKLARAGAEFGLIAANTPHIVFDEVASASPIPLISIVATAVESVRERGWTRPALFGTKFTMHGSFYSDLFSRAGIELVIPPSGAADYIHEKYMNELVLGRFLPGTRAGLLEIVDQMRENSRIDAVILAGTELPLILRESAHNGIPFLDTMRVHAEAAVAQMLAG